MLSRDKPAYVMSCYATSRSIETKQPPRLSNIMVYGLVQASAIRAEHDAEKGNRITETKQQKAKVRWPLSLSHLPACC